MKQAEITIQWHTERLENGDTLLKCWFVSGPGQSSIQQRVATSEHSIASARRSMICYLQDCLMEELYERCFLGEDA